MNNFKHCYFFLFLVSIIFILFYFSISSFYRQSARYKCWKDKQRCLSACFNPNLSKSHSQPKVLLKIVILAERKFWICLFYLVDILLKTRAFQMNLLASSNEHFVHLFVRGTQREYSSKPLNIALLNVFSIQTVYIGIFLSPKNFSSVRIS